MLHNFTTMLKSLIFTLVLFVIVALPLIPALLFHFTMYYLVIGVQDWDAWQGWSNIVTLAITLAGCFFVTRPGTFTYKVLRYIEQF